MKFTINFKPYPGATYFTFSEHQRSFDPKIHKSTNDYIIQLKKDLGYLFNIPADFGLEICDKSKVQEVLSQLGNVALKDDPTSGLDLMNGDGQTVSNNSALDLSFSFPQVPHDITSFDKIIIDPAASLGIPIEWILIFSKKHSTDFNFVNESLKNHDFNKDLFLLHKVLEDYIVKGKEVFLREANYKAAVLNQMIENSTLLDFIAEKKHRSKTMFTALCDTGLSEKMHKLGYDVEMHRVDEKPMITIANYATHSKELIEMFADRIAAL